MRACVTTSVRTTYGNQVSFTTLLGDTVFSVSATKKVKFSPGNLQWSATNGGNIATTHTVAGNGTAAGTWRFAPNHWDMIGSANSSISATYTGWLDMFGWGTSGYNSKNPYMTSTNYSDYGNGNNNISGTNYDWGVYNAIYNPKTNTTDAPGTWRTLTKDEWVYLLNTRPTLSGIRYAKAKVNGIDGLIIVPDNWNTLVYSLNNINEGDKAFTTNTISAFNWKKMENAGCVFLPLAGYRVNLSLIDEYSGYYWSTSYKHSLYEEYLAYVMSLTHSFDPVILRFLGCSVRLVRDEQ